MLKKHLLLLLAMTACLPLFAQTRQERKLMRQADKWRVKELRVLHKKQRREGKLHIWWAGFPPGREYLFVRDSIARKYGCGFTCVGGCVRSARERKFQDKHNKKIRKVLTRRNGNGWEQTLHDETGSVYQLYSHVLRQFEYDAAFAHRHGKLFDSLALSGVHFKYWIWPYGHPDTLLIKGFEADWKTMQWVTDKVVLEVLAVPLKNQFILIRPSSAAKPEEAAVVKQ